MRVDITGAVVHHSIWNSFGELRDLMASDTLDLSVLRGQSPDTSRDLRLTLVLPGRLDSGVADIGRYVPGATPVVRAAFVILDTLFFASLPGGQVAVTSAHYPPRPGLESGLVRGTITFRAVGLIVGPGGAPIETPDTITVEATFAAHWSHFLRPNVVGTFSGAGPVNGTSLAVNAFAVDDGAGGWFVDWQLDFDGLPGQGSPYEISGEFRDASPAVGTFTVGNITPVQFGNPAQWPAVFGDLFYRDDPRLGLSRVGTLTITRYVPPTVAYYGEIHGTLNESIVLWANDTTATADTVTAAVTFAVQLYPLGGIPVVP